LLPDGMLGKDFVHSAESGVIKNIWIAFQHVSDR